MTGDDAGADTAPGPADYALCCVQAYIGGARAPAPPTDAFYERQAVCFVTLKKHGELRGCIGTLEPAETSLGTKISRNAHSSAMRDPRFRPVTEGKCEAVTCSMDVLVRVSRARSRTSTRRSWWTSRQGFRRGVVLPALAGVDTVEAQVDIALQKARISPDQPYDVRRFRVTRYRQGDSHRSRQLGRPREMLQATR